MNIFLVIDSFGKPTSGLLEGSFLWLGEYSECLNISIKDPEWRGKHCLLAKPINRFITPTIVNLFLLLY